MTEEIIENDETESTEKGLVSFKNRAPVQVFLEGESDKILEELDKMVEAFVPDISTEKGRKEIGSFYRKLGNARSKFKELRLGLTAEWRDNTQKVNAEGNRIDARIDAMQEKVFRPLEEYKQKEQDRVQGYETRIKEIYALKDINAMGLAEAATIKVVLDKLSGYAPTDGDWSVWEEFGTRAKTAFQTIKTDLELALENRLKIDQEKAEEAKREAERLKQEQIDREAKIAQEAAENARLEAEAKAAKEAAEKAAEEAAERQRIQDEKDKADREAQEAKDRADQAERDRQAAIEKAEADAKAAAEAAEAAERKRLQDIADAEQRERDRLQAEKDHEESMERMREADKNHKAKIHNEIRDAIQKAFDDGVAGEDPIKDIVKAIALGKVPHVSIKY